MGTLFESFIDLIIPPRRTERLLRALTLSELEALDQEDGLPYHDPRVTALVWELKYYAHRRAAALGGALLADKLLAAAAEELGRPLLVPVPMHTARRRQRGHNQTEVLCEAALRRLGKGGTFRKKVWPAAPDLGADRRPEDFLQGSSADAIEYAPGALIRTVDTRTQQGLERSKRLRNVQNSMHAPRPELIEGRACIVVDDVATTGATLLEASRALRRAGARSVAAIALARS